MAVAAVSGDDVIVVAHQRAGAHRHRFLPNIKVKEAAHLGAIVLFERLLLETPDAQHAAQQIQLLLFGKLGIDGRGGEVFGFNGGIHKSRWEERLSDVLACRELCNSQ